MDVSVGILKFVGTVSLGLLTGVSYTTSTQSIPSLFTLPSAAAANATFKHHLRTTSKHLHALTALVTACYTLAYALAPSGRRHPYLYYTILTVGAGAGADYYLGKREVESRKQRGLLGEAEERPYVEEEDYEDVNGSVRINGEEVKRGMEGWRGRQVVRGAVDGVAFLMAVVGLWGDGRDLVQ